MIFKWKHRSEMNYETWLTGKLETEIVPDKACNDTLILDSSEESKMGLDVRMCNGNGLQGVPVGLTGSMIYAPTIKKDYVGRSKYDCMRNNGKSGNFKSFTYLFMLLHFLKICTVSGILKWKNYKSCYSILILSLTSIITIY